MRRVVAIVLLALGLVGGAHAATGGSITASVVVVSSPVNPLTVSLTVSPPIIAVGGFATAAATVSNTGSVAINNVAVTLGGDANVAISGGDTRTIATIPANSSGAVTWQLCALAAGNYIVIAQATAGPYRADSQGQLLGVMPAPAQCPKTEIANLAAGGTLTTDREGDGATPARPIETTVTTPIAGTVVIAQAQTPAPAPTAFSFMGQQILITAPLATAANPLRLAFRLEPTLAPNVATVQVFRNGVQVQACTGIGATPDPCVSSRANLPDGDVELVVLTSAASTWIFGTPIVKRGVLGAALTTSNRHVVALLVASDGNKFAGALSFDSFRSTNAAALNVSGRKAWYAGFGTDGRPFLVYAEDNGPNGRNDVFRLWIAGVEQTSDGKVSKGDVAVAS
jgi:hypothetical protein